MPPGTADARTASAEQPATGASVTGHGAPRRDRRGPRPRACRSYAAAARLRGQLPARAVAVLAPRPAAGPALAFLQLLLGPPNPALSSRLLLGILNPADELVAGQGRDVPPGIERRGVGDQRRTQVRRQFMHHPTGHFLAAHRPMVLSWGATLHHRLGGGRSSAARCRREAPAFAGERAATLWVPNPFKSSRVALRPGPVRGLLHVVRQKQQCRGASRCAVAKAEVMVAQPLADLHDGGLGVCEQVVARAGGEHRSADPLHRDRPRPQTAHMPATSALAATAPYLHPPA